MSLLETELYLDRATIPNVDAVIGQVAKHGYTIRFFEGFDFADADHSLWTPTFLEGRETGFDYHIIPRASLAADGDQAPYDPQIGDTYLGFVARNHTGSVLAAALAQLAICELTDAKGAFPAAERNLENREMIGFLLDTIKEAEIEIYEGKDSSEHFLSSAGEAPRGRLPKDYFINIGKAMIGGAVAIGGAAGFILGMAYFLGPAASS